MKTDRQDITEISLIMASSI